MNQQSLTCRRRLRKSREATYKESCANSSSVIDHHHHESFLLAFGTPNKRRRTATAILPMHSSHANNARLLAASQQATSRRHVDFGHTGNMAALAILRQPNDAMDDLSYSDSECSDLVGERLQLQDEGSSVASNGTTSKMRQEDGPPKTIVLDWNKNADRTLRSIDTLIEKSRRLDVKSPSRECPSRNKLPPTSAMGCGDQATTSKENSNPLVATAACTLLGNDAAQESTTTTAENDIANLMLDWMWSPPANANKKRKKDEDFLLSLQRSIMESGGLSALARDDDFVPTSMFVDLSEDLKDMAILAGESSENLVSSFLTLCHSK